MTSTYEHLYIGGSWVAPSGAAHTDALNPATETVIGRVPQANATDIERAIAAARAAFDDGPWPRLSPRERSAALMRVAEIMRKRRDDIISLDIAETGRSRVLSEQLFVDLPIDHFENTADHVLPRFAFEEGMLPLVNDLGVGSGVIRREPYGVAALITPFNAPFFLATFKLGAALAAGCTTVLKPSPNTPLSAFLVAEIMEEAGMPPGVVNVVTGDASAGALLTSHPAVDIVSFTGSAAVGAEITRQAAASCKKVVLELGGKSANIICEDADLAQVVPNVLMHFTVNAGQGCSLMTRTLVHESLHDQLVEGLIAAAGHVTVGDPTDPAVMMGPVISAAQREKVEAMIATGVDEGATLAFGGGRPAHLDRGFFLEPTIFVDATNSMAIARHEIFGPVATIIPFSTDDEAVALANDNDYGLAGGVWSGDARRALTLGNRLRAGHVLLNGGGPGLSPFGPFGGYKRSGNGREWGRWGLGEFLEFKQMCWPMATG